MCTSRHRVALLCVARHVVEIVRRADPDTVQVPVLIDVRELAARFPLHGVALDVAGALPDAPPECPQRVEPPVDEPPDPCEWLWAQARAHAAEAVAEGRAARRATVRGTPVAVVGR